VLFFPAARPYSASPLPKDSGLWAAEGSARDRRGMVGGMAGGMAGGKGGKPRGAEESAFTKSSQARSPHREAHHVSLEPSLI
jgi:hypothetical protein